MISKFECRSKQRSAARQCLGITTLSVCGERFPPFYLLLCSAGCLLACLLAWMTKCSRRTDYRPSRRVREQISRPFKRSIGAPLGSCTELFVFLWNILTSAFLLTLRTLFYERIWVTKRLNICEREGEVSGSRLNRRMNFIVIHTDAVTQNYICRITESIVFVSFQRKISLFDYRKRRGLNSLWLESGVCTRAFRGRSPGAC